MDFSLEPAKGKQPRRIQTSETNIAGFLDTKKANLLF